MNMKKTYIFPETQEVKLSSDFLLRGNIANASNIDQVHAPLRSESLPGDIQRHMPRLL